MQEFPTLICESVQNTLKEDGICLFSYTVSYPTLADTPTSHPFTKVYQTLSQKLITRLEKGGKEFGQKQLQMHLQQGKKKSRFACPKYTLTWTQSKTDPQKITLTANLLCEKRSVFAKKTTLVWDFSTPIPTCKEEKEAKRKKKGLSQSQKSFLT